MTIEFHACSMSNKDISFQYDGWGKIRYSYNGRFDRKGFDYGQLDISETQKIRAIFWSLDADGNLQQPRPVQAFGLDYLGPIQDLSQRVKYLIILRNIYDLNQIINAHNQNPLRENIFVRIINVIVRFITCGYATFFDDAQYRKILDNLTQTRDDPHNMNFPHHLHPRQDSAQAAFLLSEQGRDIETYFNAPPTTSLEALYRLPAGHDHWGSVYMSGSTQDFLGRLPANIRQLHQPQFS